MQVVNAPFQVNNSMVLAHASSVLLNPQKGPSYTPSPTPQSIFAQAAIGGFSSPFPLQQFYYSPLATAGGAAPITNPGTQTEAHVAPPSTGRPSPPPGTLPTTATLPTTQAGEGSTPGGSGLFPAGSIVAGPPVIVMNPSMLANMGWGNGGWGNGLNGLPFYTSLQQPQPSRPREGQQQSKIPSTPLPTPLPTLTRGSSTETRGEGPIRPQALRPSPRLPAAGERARARQTPSSPGSSPRPPSNPRWTQGVVKSAVEASLNQTQPKLLGINTSSKFYQSTQHQTAKDQEHGRASPPGRTSPMEWLRDEDQPARLDRDVVFSPPPVQVPVSVPQEGAMLRSVGDAARSGDAGYHTSHPPQSHVNLEYYTTQRRKSALEDIRSSLDECGNLLIQMLHKEQSGAGPTCEHAEGSIPRPPSPRTMKYGNVTPQLREFYNANKGRSNRNRRRRLNQRIRREREELQRQATMKTQSQQRSQPSTPERRSGGFKPISSSRPEPAPLHRPAETQFRGPRRADAWGPAEAPTTRVPANAAYTGFNQFERLGSAFQQAANPWKQWGAQDSVYL